ncbi:adhesin, partial [Burkholderia pseudomallei]|nr:adhesin [Burkholderia pseudomallei]
NTTALGAGATASNKGDVALGSGSVTAAANPTSGTTIGGVAYTFAGTGPTSVVSVGAPGAERPITNVAAGRVDATSTDAINGSQLFATNQAVTSLSTGIGSISSSVSTVTSSIASLSTGVSSLSTSTSTTASSLSTGVSSLSTGLSSTNSSVTSLSTSSSTATSSLSTAISASKTHYY